MNRSDHPPSFNHPACRSIKLRNELPTNASDPGVIETAQRPDALLLPLNGDFADIVRSTISLKILIR